MFTKKDYDNLLKEIYIKEELEKRNKDVSNEFRSGRYSNYLINDEKHVEIVSEPNSVHAEYDNSYYFDKQILAAGSFSYSKHVEITDSKSQHHAK